MMGLRRGSPLLDEQVAAGLRGDFARGLEIAEELARTSSECHRAAFNRAWYEMRKGNLLKGLELLDRGRWERAFGDPPLPTNKPIYRNENLEGKHVLLCSEGGYGDEIINVRFAADFHKRGAKVTVTCDNSLKSVFARVPGVSSVVGHKSATDVYHDFWVPGMSAARVLETEYANLNGEAYLSVDPSYQAKWRDFFARSYEPGKKPRVGLRFFGNPEFEHEQHRRFPKEGLIQAMNGLPWVNLQKEETDLRLDSWEDTIAVIDQLELVITSCTSVAHVSAALGKETWILVPILPYYIWALPGDRSPWYKSVRLFRQEKFGEWTSTFQAVAKALQEKSFL